MATLIADADGSALPFTGRLMQMMVQDGPRAQDRRRSSSLLYQQLMNCWRCGMDFEHCTEHHLCCA